MKVLIVSGGNVDIQILAKAYDKIIAVDKGLESIYNKNVHPDYIVGDFDSVNKNIIDFYKKQGIEIQKYNPEKDYTDTELGIECALTLKPDAIRIIGGIGTRIDHTLANIHILTKCLEKNIKCDIVDSHNRIYLIDKFAKIDRNKVYGKFISIIPLTSEVTGITLRGFKYPLTNYNLSFGKSLGISNELVQETASITINKGVLIVVESKD